MCYALLAGNQIYGHPWMLNWVGSSETTCNHLTYFYIFIIEIKLKYDIVQCIIYELSSGLMKLRQNFFLLNLSFLLVFILFTVRRDPEGSGGLVVGYNRMKSVYNFL
jgi:hypothetical protein